MKFFCFTAMVLCLLSCNIRSTSQQRGTPLVELLTSPVGPSSAEPHLFADERGAVYLSWVEAHDNAHVLKWSEFHGDAWAAPKTVAQGDNWFVNWADYPIFAAHGHRHRAAFFLQKSGTETYAYDIRLTVSADGGATWSLPTVLHDDGIQGEHGFMSVMPYGADYMVSWLDGRNTLPASHHSHDAHEQGGAMTLRAAIIEHDGTKSAEWELDNRVCDCCQTGVAVTANGPIVVYRGRAEDEIRDIHIVRLIDGQWTRPEPVFSDHWRIAGCPVNGPRVAASKHTVAVAWFTAPEGNSKVNVAFSADGGATFGRPIRIDGGHPIGRLGIALLDETSVAVSWLEDSHIQVAKVNIDGTRSTPIPIAKTSEMRASGFPQMVRSGDRLIFAWGDVDSKTVQIARLDFRML